MAGSVDNKDSLEEGPNANRSENNEDTLMVEALNANGSE